MKVAPSAKNSSGVAWNSAQHLMSSQSNGASTPDGML
jgi:hypothetical protein